MGNTQIKEEVVEFGDTVVINKVQTVTISFERAEVLKRQDAMEQLRSHIMQCEEEVQRLAAELLELERLVALADEKAAMQLNAPIQDIEQAESQEEESLPIENSAPKSDEW